MAVILYYIVVKCIFPYYFVSCSDSFYISFYFNGRILGEKKKLGDM